MLKSVVAVVIKLRWLNNMRYGTELDFRAFYITDTKLLRMFETPPKQSVTLMNMICAVGQFYEM